MKKEGFCTFREGARHEEDQLTASMEDYLEMLYRMKQNQHSLRVHSTATLLQVRPSSVSKMFRKLAEEGYLSVEKYGEISFSEKGEELGRKLYERHQQVERFLKFAGIQPENLLQETEKIEHMSSPETLRCLDLLVNYFDQDAQAEAKLEEMRQKEEWYQQK